MSKHIAIVHIPFEITDPAETAPSAEADEITRDIQRHGFGEAYLDEVIDTFEVDEKYTFHRFRRDELECGHGDNFECVFTVRNDGQNRYCVESVDVRLVPDEGGCECPVSIGGVGGEILFDYSHGRIAYSAEQLCRDWVGRWHRSFVGKTEDSVMGMFLIIKQIVSEGKFHG